MQNMNLGSVIMSSKIDRVNQFLEVQRGETMKIKIPKKGKKKKGNSKMNAEKEEGGCVVS